MNAIFFMYMILCVGVLIFGIAMSVKIASEKPSEKFDFRKIDAERENDRRRNEYIKHLRGVK